MSLLHQARVCIEDQIQSVQRIFFGYVQVARNPDGLGNACGERQWLCSHICIGRKRGFLEVCCGCEAQGSYGHESSSVPRKEAESLLLGAGSTAVRQGGAELVISA